MRQFWQQLQKAVEISQVWGLRVYKLVNQTVDSFHIGCFDHGLYTMTSEKYWVNRL